MNALQLISNLPATKAGVTQFIDQAVLEILNGENNPLEINLSLKILEDIIKAIRDNKDVQYAVLDEAGKYPEKSFDFNGATITKAQKTNYDFSACGDPVYDNLINQAEQLKKAIKIRQSILMQGIDITSGEIFNKPTETVSEYLTIKLK